MTNEILEQRPMLRREDSNSRFEIWRDEYGVYHGKIVNEKRSLKEWCQDWLDARQEVQYGRKP